MQLLVPSGARCYGGMLTDAERSKQRRNEGGGERREEKIRKRKRRGRKY
jgi:hypothetical protein